MSGDKTPPKQCNADRNQRKYCVYFHAKTGICTKPDDGGAWQDRAAGSVSTGPK